MSVPTILNVMPKEYIPPLKALGRYDWLNWWSLPGHEPTTRYEAKLPADPALERHADYLLWMEQMAGRQPGLLLKLFIYSKLLVDGPKVLRPTADQCVALEHVDVNLPFEEYGQPFPALLVELPEAYRRSLTDRFDYPCARFVSLFHDRPSGYIVAACENGPYRDGRSNVMSPRPRWGTVEDALRFCCEPDDPDYRLSEVAHRVAVNFGLLLTRFGTKVCGPVDPQWHAEQRLWAKRRKGHKAQRARDLLDAALTCIDFEQNVVFYDGANPESATPGENGASKRPHWRRGHFRRVPCGVGRTDRRLVFVRPCFINAEHFSGDRGDTEYRITARPRPEGDDGHPPAVSPVVA